MLDNEIPALENEKKMIEESLNSDALSIFEINEKAARIGDLICEIEEKTMRWIELND